MAQRGGPYAYRPPPKMRTHRQARAGSCGTICDLRSCISECQWLDSGGAAERGQNAPDCTFVELPCTKSPHWKKTLPSSVMESIQSPREERGWDTNLRILRLDDVQVEDARLQVRHQRVARRHGSGVA